MVGAAVGEGAAVVGVAVGSDLNDRIVAWNPAASNFFGREASEVVGETLQETLDARDPFGNRLGAKNRAFQEMIRDNKKTTHSSTQIISSIKVTRALAGRAK